MMVLYKSYNIHHCYNRSTNAHTPVVSEKQDVERSHGETAATNARRHQCFGTEHGQHRLAGRAPRALPLGLRAPVRAPGGYPSCAGG